MVPLPDHGESSYRGSGRLEGKCALVTGGDSGIGRAVAIAFAKEGADVAIAYYREHDDAKVTAEHVRAAARRAELLPCDVRDPAECKRIVEATVAAFGKLDILVNNAAFQKHRDKPEDVSIDQWTETFETNVYGYFYFVRAALPHLEAGSVIINTGSVTGLEGNEALIDYSATKGAIHALTKSLAKNLISRGIRVNCVAPGPVWTPLNPAERSDDDIEYFGASTPIGRPAQPEEIAPAYVFLASNADSNYISGEVLPLLGGGTTAG